jgi:hypothetical protein
MEAMVAALSVRMVSLVVGGVAEGGRENRQRFG